MQQRVSEQFKVRFKWSRELMDMRKQERTYFSIRDYAKAEELKKKGDRKEGEERNQIEEQLHEAIARQEKVLA